MKRGLGALAVRRAVGLCLLLTSGCDDIQQGRARAPTRTVNEAAQAGSLTDSTGRPLGGLARRIVATNEAADRDMNLVARVEVQPGELLEFYEIAPGRIMLSGAGAPVAGPLFGGGPKQQPRSAPELAALWSVAAGRAPMPAALSRAMERVGLRRANQLPRQVPLSVADSRAVPL